MKQLGKAGKKGKRRRGMNMAGLEKMLPPDFKL
jgi:hypothetical protein